MRQMKRGQERTDFPGEEIAMRTSHLDRAIVCLNKENTEGQKKQKIKWDFIQQEPL